MLLHHEQLMHKKPATSGEASFIGVIGHLCQMYQEVAGLASPAHRFKHINLK
jgi:hypothetical protein